MRLAPRLRSGARRREDRARVGDDRLLTVDVLRRPRSRPTWCSHMRACSSVSSRRSASSTARFSRPLPATRVNVQTPRSATARFVRPPTETNSSGPSSAPGVCSARTMPKAERSIPIGFRPAARAAASVSSDHLPPRRDEDDLLARPVGRVDDADGLEVQHGVVQRHRDLVGSLEADRDGQLLGICDRRKVGSCGRRCARWRHRSAPACRGACARSRACAAPRPGHRNRRLRRPARCPARARHAHRLG